MSRQCTYKNRDKDGGLRCAEVGVGRVSETSGHWLCEQHLETLSEAIKEWYATGDKDAMKRMLGHTVRAIGGAKAAADQMMGKETL